MNDYLYLFYRWSKHYPQDKPLACQANNPHSSLFRSTYYNSCTWCIILNTMYGLYTLYSFLLLVSLSMIDLLHSIDHKCYLLPTKACLWLNRWDRVNSLGLWTLYSVLLLVSLFMIDLVHSIDHKCYLLPTKACLLLNRWDRVNSLGLHYSLEVDFPR